MGNRSNSIKKNTTEQKSIAIGLNKGFVTTEIKRTEKQAKLVKQARRKGRAGRSGYEKRIMELLKAGGLKDSKKALKMAKKALGTHSRGKAKRESLMEQIRQAQKKK